VFKSLPPNKNVVFYCRTTAATLAELERMKARDRVSTAEFLARAVTAYEMMYPGPDYRPPEIRPT
jgi:hypothetical protein